MQLQQIARGVWGAQTTQSIGLGAHLPLRMTVLKDDRGLILVSPIPIDDELAQELDALGEVHAIVGPNLLHHMYLASAKQRYPSARLIGAPGLAAKKPNIPFDNVLGEEFSDGVEMQRVAGADKLSEVVFLHKHSRTLVVTDLVFNIRDAAGMSGFVLSVFSRALGKCEQSRLCRMLTNDRAQTAASIEELLRWEFDRVVPAHGDVVEIDAKRELKAGLWWMRGEARRSASV